MKQFSLKKVIQSVIDMKEMISTSTPVIISLILFFIMYKDIAEFPSEGFITIIIFLICLFVVIIVMPVLTLLIVFIPQKHLSIKWNIVTGLALSNFLWILFMFIGIYAADTASSIKEQKFLDKHNWIIEELYKQKKQYSKFPSNISALKLKDENNGTYYYEVKNSGKDFMLHFNPYQISNVKYTYCSSNVDKLCEENSDTYTNSKKLKNGWIKTKFDYD